MVSDLTNRALNITNPEKPGRIKEMMNEEKETYIQHWKEQTKDQSRLQCYLKLNREYSLADYLVSVRNRTHRHLLTKYRLSDHQLAIERGRHKKTWLPKEERICNECRSGSVETEEHFLHVLKRRTVQSNTADYSWVPVTPGTWEIKNITCWRTCFLFGSHFLFIKPQTKK